MKYLVSVLLLVVGAALLGLGYSNYSALVARENSWNENQAKFDETNWKLHQAFGSESRWNPGPQKEFDKGTPMMMLGIGGVAGLLGLLALAIPSSNSAKGNEIRSILLFLIAIGGTALAPGCDSSTEPTSSTPASSYTPPPPNPEQLARESVLGRIGSARDATFSSLDTRQLSSGEFWVVGYVIGARDNGRPFRTPFIVRGQNGFVLECCLGTDSDERFVEIGERWKAAKNNP